MEALLVFLGLLGVGILFGLLGRYIARQKNRSDSEGFWFGFLLGLLGLLIVALLPNKSNK